MVGWMVGRSDGWWGGLMVGWVNINSIRETQERAPCAKLKNLRLLADTFPCKQAPEAVGAQEIDDSRVSHRWALVEGSAKVLLDGFVQVL